MNEQNKVKRNFFNNVHYTIDEKSKRLVLKDDFFHALSTKTLWKSYGFKKVGGSSIGDVLKVDKYKSDFAAYCRIARLDMPILDQKYVHAGVVIEPKMIQVLEVKTGRPVVRFDPVKYNYDFFSDKDDVVGGLPDGYIEDTKTIVEIKTSGENNAEKWVKYGVPISYIKQAQLYSYLMKADGYLIAATFLKEGDYKNPEDFPIRDRIRKYWYYKTNVYQAKDDIDKVKTWYREYTSKPYSPSYDDSLDHDLLEWLKCSSYNDLEELRTKWILEGKWPPQLEIDIK